MDAATLVIMEDELPIIKRMKKNNRQITMEYLSYVEEEEIPLEED